MRQLLILALAAPLILAQSATWDVFTYAVPDGWQRTARDNRVEMTQVRGARFCQIGLLQSGGGTGDLREDFQKDWATLVAKPYGAPAPQPAPGQNIGNWRGMTATAAVKVPPTGAFDVTMHTFVAGKQVASLLMNGNHDGCAPQFRAFLSTLRLAAPRLDSPAPPPQTSALPSGPANITSGNIDGWQAEIQTEGVRFSRGNIVAFQFYNVALDDRLRSGTIGLNFWDLLVPRLYRVLSRTPLAEEQFAYFRKDAVNGQVADSAGRRYAAFMSTEVTNGTGTSFLALAPDEAAIRAAFPNVEALRAMRRFNYFPVNPAELLGRWTSSFNSAAETYSVATGNFTGIAVAAANVDFQFLPNGTYIEDLQAVSGKIGNLNVSKERRQGTFEVNTNTLTLRRSNGDVEVFNCGLVALRGAKTLQLVNRKFSGNRWDLFRAK